MGATFTPLSELPAIKIDRCAQILPNKLQCPRTAFYLVTPDSSSSGSSASGSSTSPATPTQGSTSSTSPQGSTGKGDSSTSAQSQDPTSKKETGSTTGTGAVKTQPPTGEVPKGGSQNQPSTNAPSSQSGAAPVEPYQLCILHKTVMEQAQKQAAQTGKPVAEVQSKILGEEENYRLNHMPLAPEEKEKHHWYELLERKVKQDESSKQSTAPAAAAQ